MSELVPIHGVLRKGNPCWIVKEKTTDTEYALVGDLSKVRDGDLVYVVGQPAAGGFCGTDRSILVSWIGTNIEGEAALPSVVKRNVKVTVSLSSRDLAPSFRLEGAELRLSGDNGRWIGNFENVSIEGKLDVYFESSVWAFQKLKLAVAVTDPEDSSKSWKKEWEEKEDKGYVVFKKTLDVGAKS